LTDTRKLEHHDSLRWALFASLGLLSAACGGSTLENGDNGGGSSQGGSSSLGGQGHGGGAQLFSCTNPTTDPFTGIVTCAEGYAHRPLAKQCGITTKIIAPPGGDPPAPNPMPRADGTVECSAETADICSVYQWGYCHVQSDGGGPQLATCRSGCVSDSDCGDGYACLCNSTESPTSGSCQYVSCRTDQDCGSGLLCATAGSTCGSDSFACQTKADKCTSDEDCGTGVRCVYGEGGDQVRHCGSGVVCGRPFLVEAEQRLAPLVNGGAWLDSAEELPRVDHLSWSERSALAEHWAYLGRMEHASIAAFARFSLQLLSLGAPPDLVDACTQALADETAHTKLCFRIASAYAGRALGPGPLDVQRSLEMTSLEQIVDLVIAEGCFGETSAALDALEAADNATDPVIAASYTRIAADEQRHAELAFRFVRWALERGDHAVRAAVRGAVASPPRSDAASRQVVLPCLAALLDEESASVRVLAAS
jgi:hypothetical protein